MLEESCRSLANRWSKPTRTAMTGFLCFSSSLETSPASLIRCNQIWRLLDIQSLFTHWMIYMLLAANSIDGNSPLLLRGG